MPESKEKEKEPIKCDCPECECDKDNRCQDHGCDCELCCAYDNGVYRP